MRICSSSDSDHYRMPTIKEHWITRTPTEVRGPLFFHSNVNATSPWTEYSWWQERRLYLDPTICTKKFRYCCWWMFNRSTAAHSIWQHPSKRLAKQLVECLYQTHSTLEGAAIILTRMYMYSIYKFTYMAKCLWQHDHLRAYWILRLPTQDLL